MSEMTCGMTSGKATSSGQVGDQYGNQDRRPAAAEEGGRVMSIPFKIFSIRRTKARPIIILGTAQVIYPELGINFRHAVINEAASMAVVRLRIARATIKKEQRHD